MYYICVVTASSSYSTTRDIDRLASTVIDKTRLPIESMIEHRCATNGNRIEIAMEIGYPCTRTTTRPFSAFLINDHSRTPINKSFHRPIHAQRD